MDTTTRPTDNLMHRLLPCFEFGERHTTRIQADAATVYRAIQDVTPREIALMRELVWLRELPARLTGRGNSTSMDSRPFLKQMLDGGFVVLAEDPPFELVFGAIDQSWRLTGGASSGIQTAAEFAEFDRPEFNRIVGNLRVEEAREGVVLSTETRVHVPDLAARRKFARYWRVIYPASWLLRVTWLRAIKRRAERDRAASAAMATPS